MRGPAGERMSRLEGGDQGRMRQPATRVYSVALLCGSVWAVGCGGAQVKAPVKVAQVACPEGGRVGQDDLAPLVQQRIEAALPDIAAKVTGRLQVEVSAGVHGQVQLNLDNLWVETGGECAGVSQGIERRIATLGRMVGTDQAPLGSDEVRALVRSKSEVERYLRLLAERTGPSDDTPVVRTLAGDLVVAYSFDLPDSVRWMLDSDLTRLGLADEELATLAAQNLWRSLSIEARTSDDGSFVMLVAGGTYEASLMVVPLIWERMADRVAGDPVVCVSNRDVLVATGSDRADGMAKLTVLCRHLFQTGSYPVSPLLYRWSKGSWEVATLPGLHGAPGS